MAKLSLNQIAASTEALGKFVSATISGYKAMSVRLHETACALFVHTANHGDCSQLNKFYNALRVNDQTALRVWLGKHSSFVDLENGQMRNWLSFSQKDGFRVAKGVEAFRKDLFTVEAEALEEGQTDTRTVMIEQRPFFDKDVRSKDAITLEKLLAMLGKAATSVEKGAKENDVKLPADVLNLVTSIKNTVEKEEKALERIKEKAE